MRRRYWCGTTDRAYRPRSARILERFWRGRHGELQGGFGLDLPIGRGLARRLGGELRLVDSADGACFVLTLPSAPVEAQAPVNR